jgi:exodeoxyribonuclease VII large subunit
VADTAIQSRQPGANVPELTVSELSSAIKRALEEGFGYVRLRGEISGFRGAHSSGHCYFSLKDDKAKIDAVVWRGSLSRLKVKPAEGLEVVAQGRITTFPGSSKYQIIVEAMEAAGVGALMALLEERKRKLAAEGLFAAERKRKLPFLPAVVGIVTSPTGAVIRDMLAGFTERFPTRVLLWPVRVQGETCAPEVAAAIRGFNALGPGGPLPRPDVLIVARGGGSLEDLWGFNEEIVVRAAAESRIPLISAVGHETDWTLLDLVADARAPTPTKAAEWAVPKHSELLAQTGDLGTRLGVSIRRMLEAQRAHLKASARGLPRLEDLLALPRQRFDAAGQRLGRALLANTRAHAMRQARITARLQPRLLAQRIERAGERLARTGQRAAQALQRTAGVRRNRHAAIGGRLQPQLLANLVAVRRRQLETGSKLLASLSYQGVLSRGFALVRDAEGRTVRSAGAVQEGQRLDIELQDGRLATVVTGATSGSTDTETAAEGTAHGSSAAVRRRRPRTTSGQGTLF